LLTVYTRTHALRQLAIVDLLLAFVLTLVRNIAVRWSNMEENRYM